MLEVITLIVKITFIIVIYLFIFSIVRLIYLDIKSTNSRKTGFTEFPYIKLINQKETLDFRVEEAYTLDRSIVIGRQDTSDIVIKDPYISGKHIKFEKSEDGWWLKDLESKNGTRINGEKMKSNDRVPLKSGDRIGFGILDFIFILPVL